MASGHDQTSRNAFEARARIYTSIKNRTIRPIQYMNSLATGLLERCRDLGIELTPTDRGVRCVAPSGTMTAELRDLIAASRERLRDLLLFEEDVLEGIPFCEEQGQSSSASPAWSLEVSAAADFVLLLAPDDLPSTPFELEYGRHVVDASRFLESL